MILGAIHSIESMGLVDGPGVRSVVFMQGCRLRCQYCHNPDTWNGNAKLFLTPDEAAKRLFRFREYYQNGGGVTLSGGEPLLQLDFAIALFTLLKQSGIHTCLDTAGVGDITAPDYDSKLAALLEITDLVLLDIKHYDPTAYREITGQDMTAFSVFADHLRNSHTPVWLRHVVVPSLTDSEDHIRKLKAYATTFAQTEKIELLGYHTLGVSKYIALHLPYPLADTPPLDKSLLRQLQHLVEQ